MRPLALTLLMLLGPTPALAAEALPACPPPEQEMILSGCPRAGCVPGEPPHVLPAPRWTADWLARPDVATLLALGLARRTELQTASFPGMQCDLAADGALTRCTPHPANPISDGPTSAKLVELASRFKVGLTPLCEGAKPPRGVGVVVTYDYRTGAFAGTLNPPVLQADD